MKNLYQVILSLSAVFMLFFTQTSAANESAWTVAEISGDVKVIRGNMHKINYNNTVITVGEALLSGDSIKTGKNSRIILIQGSKSIIISPQSIMKLPKKQNNSRFTRIIQSLGTLLFSVDKKDTQHFEVKTPYLAAVVKGTTFTVNVSKSGAVVHVIEGAVEVTPLKGPPQIINPGQTAFVSVKSQYKLDIKGYNAPSSDVNDSSNHYTTKVMAIKSINRLIKPTMANFYKNNTEKSSNKNNSSKRSFHSYLKSDNQKSFIKNHNNLKKAAIKPVVPSVPTVTPPTVTPPVTPPTAPPVTPPVTPPTVPNN